MRFVLLLAGSLAIFVQAHAQTLYRCGSVYQDRPCEAGAKGKVVGSTGAEAAAAPATAGVDAECVQRARDSQKIVWAREGGATEERLLADARSARERRLIQDVYRRPGAASTVQAGVQADCVAEKQREEQEAAVAIAAALKARRASGDAPTSAEPPRSVQAAAAEPSSAERETERRARTCARYNADMDRLRSEERAGGSSSRMDSLNERRRALREQIARSGC